MREMIGGRRKGKPAVVLSLPISPELKRLIGEKAMIECVPMNELVAEILANHFGRPELGRVPRKPYGRPIGNGHGSRRKTAAAS